MQAYEPQANAAFNDMEEAVSEFSKAAKKRKDDGGDTTGGGASTSKRVAKSVDALKPDVLTKAMKPTEFRNWRRRFDDWYTTSCFDTMTMVEALAMFSMFVREDKEQRRHDWIIFNDEALNHDNRYFFVLFVDF